MNEKMIKEILEKAKTPEDVIAQAKEKGEELALEQAKELLEKVKNAVTGELSDEDLDAVAGGRVEIPQRAGADLLAQDLTKFGVR